jgi:hypothetical protein
MKSLTSLCSPALLYLILSGITLLLVVTKLSAISIGLKAIFIIIWTWFLNFLCSEGHESISWFLVLLPIVMMLIVYYVAIDAAMNCNSEISGYNLYQN